MLKLHSQGTPNGQRVTILLKVLDVPFEYQKIDLMKLQQYSTKFRSMNPFSKIPTLEYVQNGEKRSVFEGSCVLEYIANEYDKNREYSYEPHSDLYYEQQEWLVSASTALGNYMFEAFQWITIYGVKHPGAKVDEYVWKKYVDDVVTCCKIYEERLKNNKNWLVGNKANIADFATLPWLLLVDTVGINIAEFPHLSQYIGKLMLIKGVKEGLNYDRKKFSRIVKL